MFEPKGRLAVATFSILTHNRSFIRIGSLSKGDNSMKLSTWLTISAVVAAVFGLGFVLVTGPLMSIYGVTLDKAGTLVA